MDDEQYILRLIGQVIKVSLETTKIIGTLPEVNPDTRARFTVPLRDWQGALWAVRVVPAAPGSADTPRPVSRLSPGLPTPRSAA
jgi:hypothetical protein